MNEPTEPERQAQEPREILTARTEATINAAVAEGYYPLVKRVHCSKEIFCSVTIAQNRRNGAICDCNPFRFFPCNEHPEDKWEVVIDEAEFYPYNWPSPFAAYLLPPDLEVGECVILSDLIEDHVGCYWSNGRETTRLDACEAVWNGTDFEIDWEKTEGPWEAVG